MHEQQTRYQKTSKRPKIRNKAQWQNRTTVPTHQPITTHPQLKKTSLSIPATTLSTPSAPITHRSPNPNRRNCNFARSNFWDCRVSSSTKKIDSPRPGLLGLLGRTVRTVDCATSTPLMFEITGI
ncbi:uncharacterized protein BKA78DRAFT_319703 [Phyllosticta capitalensis]|uniref:uncharacterized protein n=1 Tax=Phyllosticta capitalensis TaxID=121624 RepID=UPI00312F0111